MVKVKIPKTVAGVKVPKKLRKRGKQLIAKAQDFSASPAGREAIAAGLTIAGAAIAAGTQARQHKAATKRAAAAEAPRTPGQAGTDPQHDVGAAITAGIGALQSFLAGRRAG